MNYIQPALLHHKYMVCILTDDSLKHSYLRYSCRLVVIPIENEQEYLFWKERFNKKFLTKIQVIKTGHSREIAMPMKIITLSNKYFKNKAYKSFIFEIKMATLPVMKKEIEEAITRIASFEFFFWQLHEDYLCHCVEYTSQDYVYKSRLNKHFYEIIQKYIISKDGV